MNVPAKQTPGEIIWSSGSRMEAATIVQAFRLQGKEDLVKRADASPVSASSGVGCVTVIVLVVILLIFLSMLRGCMACDPQRENCSNSGSTWRSGGGSYGGYSSGGGHK